MSTCSIIADISPLDATENVWPVTLTVTMDQVPSPVTLEVLEDNGTIFVGVAPGGDSTYSVTTVLPNDLYTPGQTITYMVVLWNNKQGWIGKKGKGIVCTGSTEATVPTADGVSES